jgi:xylose isomerase
MRMYRLLRERAAKFRQDPEVQAAMRDSKLAELAQPTLGDRESLADLLRDKSAYETFDAGKVAQRGCGYVRLNQLAIEHLLGAR